MATYDNKIWLLKNIRDAFIATDETGLCEIVMGGEDLSKIFQNKAVEERKKVRERRLTQPSTSKGKECGMGDISEEDDDKEIVTQYDPYPDMDESDEDDIVPGSSYMPYDEFGGHRQRSNTAQWLDKKEQSLKKAAKIKIIKWEDPSTPLTPEQLAEEFANVEVKKPQKEKSLLSEQLEKCPVLPHCQYLEYAKYDGSAQLGLPTKSFKIFITMAPEKLQNYPIVVCVIATAKIKDLIGFTCYKYSIAHPEVKLGSVNDNGLCIAEDDGEVDLAFPCLDANEPCSKFGFTCLGLIELKAKHASPPEQSSIPECSVSGAFYEFPKAMESSQSNPNTSSRQNTGGSATSEAVLNAIKAVNADKKAATEDLDKIHPQLIVAEAPQYKNYKVHLLRKVRTNTPVQLVISLDRIEVEPLDTHKHPFWSKSKYFRHSIDSVAWCQILESKACKTTFRIVYSPSHNVSYSNNTGASFLHPNTTYKMHDFDCDHDSAREIVDRVNTILELRNSPCRREYKTAKEKKLQTRRSFHTKHLS